MRSAGEAEHRTGEHPAQRTLVADRLGATLRDLGDGLSAAEACSVPRQAAKAAARRPSQSSPRAIARQAVLRPLPGMLAEGQSRRDER
jgi:hypothetical protein